MHVNILTEFGYLEQVETLLPWSYNNLFEHILGPLVAQCLKLTLLLLTSVGDSKYVVYNVIPFYLLPSVCLKGVLRMEDVPGALLGVFPCRWLFPETVRRSAQLICSWGNKLSYCNLFKALYRHLPFAYPSNLSYCSLRSPCSSERWVLYSAPSPGGISSVLYRPRPKPSSQLFLIQTLNSPALPQLPAHFVWNASNSDFVHRKYQSICCTICDWWHVKVFGSDDDFFASSYSTFTVTSKKYKGIMEQEQKEGPKDGQRRRVERKWRENFSWKTFRTMIDTQRANISMMMFTTFHVYNARCM